MKTIKTTLTGNCFRNLVAAILLLLTINAYSQLIVVDGASVLVSDMAKFPFWLKASQTLASGTNVISISVIEYNLTASPSGGNILTLEQVVKVTASQTVPSAKVWKVEAVLLDPLLTGGNNSSAWIDDGTVVRLFTATDKVGVGTTAPASVLHSAGQIRTGIPSGGLGGAAATDGALLFNNAANINTVNITSGVTAANYALTLPTAQGAASTLLTNNGAGVLSWTGGNSSTIFTQWGRADCPSTSSLVYWGYAASDHYTHGGVGNALCLTSAPDWTGASFSDGNQNGGLLYGAEFQGSGHGVATFGAFTSAEMQDYDGRCAVCIVTGASVTLMIPGSVVCPVSQGWTRQYWGYLMANHYTQAKSEAVCVVNNPTRDGSNADHNGTLWYPVETELGSLTSPYVHDREVTCAVCTK